MTNLEPVIGLEIHVQLNTNTKMFCSCENRDELGAPNVAICPICTGQPGTLPFPNKAAIQKGILAGLALQAEIPNMCKFDRKHYFYPDLPKGYQISQFDEPLVKDGAVEITDKNGETKIIRIERAHLEEDAAKNLHTPDGTLVDYNRAGAPLLEIVTRPDFSTSAEAKQFLQELRLLMRTVNVSNADMEKGQMRCDVNISLRPTGSQEFFPKTEIKNVNSFKSVERAIEFEIKRQTKLWETNTPPNVTTTRGWDDMKQETIMQRTKEAAHDYRYFPEPDIPPLFVADLILEARGTLPELPKAYKARLTNEFHFKPADAQFFAENRDLGNFVEQAMSELHEQLPTVIDGTLEEILERDGEKLGKQVSAWITSKLQGILLDKKLSITETKLDAENFAELMMLIFSRRVNSTTALTLLEKMVETGVDPSIALEDMGVSTETVTTDALDTILTKVIGENPDAVEKYKAGKTALIEFLVGMCMKQLKGQGDPTVIKAKLLERI